MKIDIVIDDDVVDVVETFEDGGKSMKRVSLDEWLEKYMSLMKENDNSCEYLFLPAGTVEFFKNTNTKTYVVHTRNYKEFYGLKDLEKDYLFVITMGIFGTVIESFDVYETEGAFSKYISSFVKIYSSNNDLEVDDEARLVPICMESFRIDECNPIGVKCKYKDIVF